MPAADIAAVRAKIRAGGRVRMGFCAGARVWWFDHPYAEVDDATMREAAVGHNGQPLMEEAGDCLFGWEGNSQTWVSVFG